ncbi:bifunctional phosphoribosyl-AMP cyclohydrolase/phosphoribosyl-ATP diphosphatase HisIE [Nannocystaceae bacterium ST9]
MSESLATLWSRLAPDAAGLVAALIVHAEDARVLMLGYMSREALATTLERREVTFFSRSKQRLWTKGESSGHTLELRSLRVDCDGDALLIEAIPRGPTCHTGADSCFFTPVELDTLAMHEDDGPAIDPLTSLWRTILARKAGEGLTNREGQSYVRRLLDAGPGKIAAKIREEADELARALEGETDDRVASEAADLLFHALVGLAARGLEPRAVGEVIRARHGLSGIDEHASRSAKPQS